MTNSTCYNESGTVEKHYGIVVHSTGVNQPRIARYVQPSDDDPAYDTIVSDIGRNPYKNDWNHTNVRKGVHCFIGNNAAGKVVCYQVLPWEQIAWGVWKGDNGSFNDNPPYFQFEICEDGLTDEKYFQDCMTTAQELCAYLCRTFEIPVDKIVSHYEAWEQGYGNKHYDPHNWMSKFGKDMNWFRNEVIKLLNTTPTIFNKGDKVKLLSDKNINGVQLASWVTDGRPLYVIASNETKTAVTVNADLKGVTANMRTCDVAPYDEQGDDSIPAPDPDPEPKPDPEPGPEPDPGAKEIYRRIAELCEELAGEFRKLGGENA